MPIYCELYLAGADSNPSGGALAVDTVIVNTFGSGQPLNASARYAEFSSPVKVSQPYVVVVSNYSNIDFTLVNSNWNNNDGGGEWLAPVNISGIWNRPHTVNVGGADYDADPMIYPHVSYEAKTDFTYSPLCLSSSGTVTFTNPQTGVAWSRFYNQNAYFGTEKNSFIWDFGDGSSTVTTVDTSHAYSSAGPYTVSLTTSIVGWNTTCVDTVSKTIPGSVPNTSFTNTAVLLDATFTDASTGAETWAWDFGDGATSTMQNPMHTYATPGTYTVCLTTTNDCGSDSTCNNITVICPDPVAGFNFTVNGLTATFSNTSSNVVTNNWTFQNAGTDTAANPMKTWNSAGTYQVCLTTTNTCGTDSICKSVTVSCAAPVTNFTNTSVLTTANFNNTSFSVTIAIWDFGDGNTSTAFSPSHTYAAPGTYTVCLIGTNVCGMGSDTTCQQVTVTCTDPVASFAANFANLFATFSDSSTGINVNGWLWDFGDGQTSTQQNPTHAYDTSGTYTVCLITSNQCGADTTCQTFNVVCALPTASFNWSNNQTAASFTSTSSSTAGGISSYAWTFGDGQTSTQQNPSHTYTFLGNYTVCLTVTDTCGSSQYCDTVNLIPVSNTLNLTDHDVVVYPNPAAAEVNLRFDGKILAGTTVALLDMHGREIRKWYLENSNSRETSLNLSGIQSGSYLLILNSGTQMLRRKIMISSEN